MINVLLAFSAYDFILMASAVVAGSYLFSWISRLTRIPSVLLLIASGMVARLSLESWGWKVLIPPILVELLGTVGLIMIVLEAGLDLELQRSRLPLIRDSFLSAAGVLALSTVGVATALLVWLPDASWRQGLLYGLVLSVVSSAIVLPSVLHLRQHQREFLIYEAAFSDVLGITVFNLLASEQAFSVTSLSWFVAGLPLAAVLSLIVCLGLLALLAQSQINIKFFLIFSVLLMVYIIGKKLKLPSLLTVMMFGLVANNLHLFHWGFLKPLLAKVTLGDTLANLKSVTAETSFLIRTFFSPCSV